MIGSISDWTSCFPANLNQQGSSLIDFERILFRHWQKTFEDPKVRGIEWGNANGIHCNNRSIQVRVALACDGPLPIGISLIASECFSCVGAVNYISKM